MPNKRYQWKTPDEIEGLDEPMIHPVSIPNDKIQSWHKPSKKWELRNKKK